MEEVADEAVERARKVIALRERARSAATEKGGRKTGNLLRAIDSLFKQPVVTAKSLAKELGLSFVTANAIALTLVELRLLSEETGYRRNRRVRFAPYLELFEEPLRAERGARSPSKKSRTPGRTRA